MPIIELFCVRRKRHHQEEQPFPSEGKRSSVVSHAIFSSFWWDILVIASKQLSKFTCTHELYSKSFLVDQYPKNNRECSFTGKHLGHQQQKCQAASFTRASQTVTLRQALNTATVIFLTAFAYQQYQKFQCSHAVKLRAVSDQSCWPERCCINLWCNPSRG